jgi:hypothetical protein
MILAFKTTFPNGTATDFENKILQGSKIHSLREGNRWQEGYFIHMATGVRTTNYNQFNTAREDLQKCKGTQEVFMTYNNYGALEVTIDDDLYLMQSQVDALISNDGLTREQFITWFFPKGKDVWTGQIIHWTNFKYSK